MSEISQLRFQRMKKLVDKFIDVDYTNDVSICVVCLLFAHKYSVVGIWWVLYYFVTLLQNNMSKWNYRRFYFPEREFSEPPQLLNNILADKKQICEWRATSGTD